MNGYGLNKTDNYSIQNATTEQRESEIYADCIMALGERPVEPACSNENAEVSKFEELVKLRQKNPEMEIIWMVHQDATSCDHTYTSCDISSVEIDYVFEDLDDGDLYFGKDDILDELKRNPGLYSTNIDDLASDLLMKLIQSGRIKKRIIVWIGE